MQCLTLTADGRIDAIAAVTSADQCPTSALLLSEPGDSSLSPFPSAEDCAAAWGIGFVMVVGCYVIARAAGAVVNFIDKP